MGWMRHQGYAANRGYLADFAMGSVFVVVPAPILQLLPGLFKAREPVSIQAFGPQLAVERFHERIVGRSFERWASQGQADRLAANDKGKSTMLLKAV